MSAEKAAEGSTLNETRRLLNETRIQQEYWDKQLNNCFKKIEDSIKYGHTWSSCLLNEIHREMFKESGYEVEEYKNVSDWNTGISWKKKINK